MLNGSKPPTSVDSWVSQSDLFSPYVFDLISNPRALEANLECSERSDGTFHYVYKVKAESHPEFCPRFSRSSIKAKSVNRNRSVSSYRPKSSGLSTKTPSDVLSSSMDSSDSVPHENPLNIKFTLITEDGPKFLCLGKGVNGSLTLKELLWHFHDKITEEIGDDFCPRLALLLDKKPVPIRQKHLGMRVDQLPANAVEIIANNL